MTTKGSVGLWLDELKAAWEAGDPTAALKLFQHTTRYYERPFYAGTTQDEFQKYWADIVGLENIRFDYKIVAVDGSVACVHWQNSFRSPSEDRAYLLDGMFQLEFDDQDNCREFRQWWFMKE